MTVLTDSENIETVDAARPHLLSWINCISWIAIAAVVALYYLGDNSLLRLWLTVFVFLFGPGSALAQWLRLERRSLQLSVAVALSFCVAIIGSELLRVTGYYYPIPMLVIIGALSLARPIPQWLLPHMQRFTNLKTQAMKTMSRRSIFLIPQSSDDDIYIPTGAYETRYNVTTTQSGDGNPNIDSLIDWSTHLERLTEKKPKPKKSIFSSRKKNKSDDGGSIEPDDNQSKLEKNNTDENNTENDETTEDEK